MNFKLSTLAAAAALLVNCSAPVMAADSDFHPVATVHGWEIVADHEFCVASQDFANETELSFGLYTSGRAVIFIKNKRWTIPDGSYPVVVSVDRTAPVTLTSKGRGKLLALPWKLSETEINIMSNGAFLRATVGRETYEYALAGSAEMLKALSQCISARMAAANPFDGQPSASAPPANPFAETSSNPYRRM